MVRRRNPFWIADKEDAKIYAYKLKTDESESPPRITIHCPNATEDFNTLEAVGNTDPMGIFSDGSTMWVVDNTTFTNVADGSTNVYQKIFAYNQLLSANNNLKNLALSNVYEGAQLLEEVFESSRTSYTNGVYVLYPTEVTTVTAAAQDPDAGVVVTKPADANLAAPGHQVHLPAESATEIVITVTAENAAVKEYIVKVDRKSGGRTPTKDFNLAPANENPRGIWSNGTTWRVASLNNIGKRIYVYDPPSDSYKMLNRNNEDPQSLWSDNTTELWITDRADKKIYIYNSSGASLIREVNIPRPPEFNRDSQHVPKGLWSNGTILWVANEGSGGAPPKQRIYAYEHNRSGTSLVAKSTHNILLDGEHEIEEENNLGVKIKRTVFNTEPREIWSNGTTMWVEDTEVIYAYSMWKVDDQGETVWGGLPDQPKNIDIRSITRSTEDRGIWSDGTTLWVAGGRKLYAFNLPKPGARLQSGPSEDATLSDLRLSGMTLAPVFSPEKTYYTAQVDHTFASTKVMATPNHSAATVEILWSSDVAATIHTANRGPQVSLEEGYNVIVMDVTAENGRLETYFVEVTKTEAPPVSGGPLPVFQSASVGNNPTVDSASSSAGIGEWKSQLIFAEPLLDGGVRFVFAVPAAEEFGIEETPDLLGETWRPLPEDEFKMIQEIREDNVDSQDRLTIILPKAEGKQRFLRLIPLK